MCRCRHPGSRRHLSEICGGLERCADYARTDGLFFTSYFQVPCTKIRMSVLRRRIDCSFARTHTLFLSVLCQCGFLSIFCVRRGFHAILINNIYGPIHRSWHVVIFVLKTRTEKTSLGMITRRTLMAKQGGTPQRQGPT